MREMNAIHFRNAMPKRRSETDYFENVCCSMLVEGRPGRLKPFVQSSVVVGAVEVVFGDQMKKPAAD